MKKLIITALLTLQLFAQNTTILQNPFTYSALSDEIYNNVNNIEKLQFMPEYETDITKIKNYVKDVQETKNKGYKIEDKEKNIDNSFYLKALRKLSLTNNYYVNKINNDLFNSIKNIDNDLFLKSVNSGLVIMPNNKKSIIEYYHANKNNIEATGILKSIIDEYNDNKKPIQKGLTDAQLNKLEITRIRKRDKIKQAAIERSLEEEVVRKKIEIRKIQKEKLGIKSN
ncbi:MAG: hypothetical protein L3I99_07060 [Sulfurimonas sp.]|nr:hypothetical protein [Sulfurimonas sp.]